MDTKPLFDIGQVLATPEALQALERNGTDAGPYLHRHKRGDWGDIPDDQKHLNAQAAFAAQERVYSVYTLPDKTQMQVTTVLERPNKTTISLHGSSQE